MINEHFFGGAWNIQERIGFVMAGALAGTVISVLFSRFTSQQYREKEKAFFEQMVVSVDFEKEVGGANDASQALILGRIILKR